MPRQLISRSSLSFATPAPGDIGSIPVDDTFL